MALSVLPNGIVLACADALERGALFRLRRVPGVADIVAVSREDAVGFGLNLVAAGDDVVVAGAAPPTRVERALERHGMRTVVVPLDEFHRAGGSAACLVAAVHDEAARQSTVPRGETPRVSSLLE
jgi:N-dimethylarginine dimethylaminohydrolase